MNYCKVYELGLVGGEEFEHSENGFGDTQRREREQVKVKQGNHEREQINRVWDCAEGYGFRNQVKFDQAEQGDVVKSSSL